MSSQVFDLTEIIVLIFSFSSIASQYSLIEVNKTFRNSFLPLISHTKKTIKNVVERDLLCYSLSIEKEINIFSKISIFEVFENGSLKMIDLFIKKYDFDKIKENKDEDQSKGFIELLHGMIKKRPELSEIVSKYFVIPNLDSYDYRTIQYHRTIHNLREGIEDIKKMPSYVVSGYLITSFRQRNLDDFYFLYYNCREIYKGQIIKDCCDLFEFNFFVNLFKDFDFLNASYRPSRDCGYEEHPLVHTILDCDIKRKDRESTLNKIMNGDFYSMMSFDCCVAERIICEGEGVSKEFFLSHVTGLEEDFTNCKKNKDHIKELVNYFNNENSSNMTFEEICEKARMERKEEVDEEYQSDIDEDQDEDYDEDNDEDGEEEN